MGTWGVGELRSWSRGQKLHSEANTALVSVAEHGLGTMPSRDV